MDILQEAKSKYSNENDVVALDLFTQDLYKEVISMGRANLYDSIEYVEKRNKHKKAHSLYIKTREQYYGGKI